MIPAGPRRWYTPMADYAITVHLQLVYGTDLKLKEISPDNPVPNNWSQQIKTFAMETTQNQYLMMTIFRYWEQLNVGN